jgi:ATP-dependent DNA ligase
MAAERKAVVVDMLSWLRRKAQADYETWVGWGGEGIVLKEPTSIYRPGIRSPAWLKVKPKLTLEAVVTGGSPELIPWGDWGKP